MSSLAKRWLIIVGVLVGVLAIVGTTVGVILNKPKTAVARSERLDAPVINSVETQGDRSLLVFTGIQDASGYLVSEYDEVKDETHMQIYSGDDIIYAGLYVKVDITQFLFATHTMDDFKQYKFTVMAKYSDPAFNSKQSDVFEWDNKIKLAKPVIASINPKASSARWQPVEYATNYDVFLVDEDGKQSSNHITTVEPYVSFSSIKSTFGNKTSYNICVVAKNTSTNKQAFIQKSEPSENALYIPNGKLSDFNLNYNAERKTISWMPVVGASGYNLYINKYGLEPFANSKTDGQYFSITASIISCDLSQIEYAGYLGDVEIFVEAYSSNENIEPSESNLIVYTNTRKLAAPKNIKIVSDANNLKVSWDPSEDASFANGYRITFFTYTKQQAQNDLLTVDPQNHNEVAHFDQESSLCEFTIMIAASQDGYFGVGICAVSVEHSQFENSEITYYKNENNKNLYNANKLLSAPTGIVAVENQDGTISVSWNIVENARRYFVKITSVDGTGSNVEIQQDDDREQFDRVNTTIPPKTLTNLIPGRYKLAVRTGSEGFAVSDDSYNASVNYPNGQDFVTYKKPYDLTSFEISYNNTSKELSWSSVEGATYEVYGALKNATKQSIGTSLTQNYNLTEYFDDLSHDTGVYEFSVMVKGNASNYMLDTMSKNTSVNFVQKYATPKALQILSPTNPNEAILSWEAGANASANTIYEIDVNGTLLQSATLSLDVTNYMQLGANTISVKAKADETHFESAKAVLDYVYKYTLTQIDGEISVVAMAQAGGQPQVELQFSAVKNAQGYVVNINNEGETNYQAVVSGTTATITLSGADVEKLTPFKTSVISVAATNGTNPNILLPQTSISKQTSFVNKYFVPSLNSVSVNPELLNTNIINEISESEREIEVSFTPLVIVGDLNEQTGEYDVYEIANYKVQVVSISNNEVVKDFNISVDLVYDFDSANGEVQNLQDVSVNVFNSFANTIEPTLLVSGAYKLMVAGIYAPNSVVGVLKASNNVFITPKLSKPTNINYAETTEGMILSWGEVFGANNYDVHVTKGGTDVATINVQTNRANLSNVLFDKEIGSYDVVVTAKYDNTMNRDSDSFAFEVEKQLHILEANLIANNTKITISEQNLPRTIYKSEEGSYVYATSLMLVFDSADGAALKKKDVSQLSGYLVQRVDFANVLTDDLLTFENGVYTIELKYPDSQTCYVYAFIDDADADVNFASTSEVQSIDLTGVVRYLTPHIVIENVSNSLLTASWQVEFLPISEKIGDDVVEKQKTTNFAIDFADSNSSIINTLKDQNKLSIVGLDANGDEILDIISSIVYDLELKSLILTLNENSENYLNLKTIVLGVMDQVAGNYTVKVRALTTNSEFAGNSGIAEQNFVFFKTLQNPNYRLTKSDDNDYVYANLVNDVDLDAQNFKLYIGSYDLINNTISYDTIDGIALNRIQLVVTKDVGNDNISGNDITYADVVYAVTSHDDHGYYLTINKHILKVNEEITSINPQYFAIEIRYASGNEQYYKNKSTFAYVAKLEVINCTPSMVVEDVMIVEIPEAFGITWSVPNNEDVEYSLSIREVGGTTDLFTDANTTSIPEIEYGKETSIGASYSPSTVYVVKITTNILGYTETRTDYFLINNGTKQIKLNRDTNQLTLTFNNSNSFVDENGNALISGISINGFAFDVDACTANTITLNNADAVLASVALTLSAERKVNVFVFGGEEVKYEGEFEKFPVIISSYASDVKVVNDDLYWNSVNHNLGYKVFKIEGGVETVLANNTTFTNNFAPLSALFANGNQYVVYVQVITDEAQNIFSDGAVRDEYTIVYKKPFDSVSSLNYVQTFNQSTYTFNKKITFVVDGDAPSTDEFKKFVVSINGNVSRVVNATLNPQNGEIAFTKNGGTYEIDLSNILNELDVGEYTVSVSVTSTEHTGVYEFRTNSKNTLTVFNNNKVISVPVNNFADYFEITPDAYVESVDANTSIAQASINATNLKQGISTFNSKVFTLKQSFEFATRVELIIDGNAYSMANIKNASVVVPVQTSNIQVQLVLYIENNTLGNLDFYYIPTNSELNSESLQSVEHGVKKNYEQQNVYFAQAMPTFEISYAEPLEGQTGENICTITITNASEGRYLLTVYDAQENYDALDCFIEGRSAIVTLQSGENTINLNAVLAELNIPYCIKFVSLTKLKDLSNTNIYDLSSFASSPVMFNHHYILGNLGSVNYANGKLSFNILEASGVKFVKYNVTLSDEEDVSRVYECVVEFNDGTYAINSQNIFGESLQIDLFTLQNNVLTFDVTQFTKDSTRVQGTSKTYYLAGYYNYSIFASDAAPVVAKQTPSENNIISSDETYGEFLYQQEYPVEFSAKLEGNILKWTYVDNSGIENVSLNNYWEYKLNINDPTEDWKKLNFVDVVANGNQFNASTTIMLSYTQRQNIAETFRLRVNVQNDNYIKTNGKPLTSLSVPQLPSVNLNLNIDNARDLSFEFDYSTIKNLAKAPYFADDLNANILLPQILITLVNNGNVYNLSLTDYVGKWYADRIGSVNLIQIISKQLTEQQKQELTITKNGEVELKDGQYEISAQVVNRTNTQENTFYADSEISTINAVIVPRWIVSNVSLNQVGIDGNDPYITYVGDLPAGEKGLSSDKAKRWADGNRTTILHFTVDNYDGVMNVDNLRIRAWLVPYSTYVDQGLVASPKSVIPSLAAQSYELNGTVLNVSVDVTEIWTSASSPTEYFIAFYLEHYGTGENQLRRDSIKSTHSDDNAVLKSKFGNNTRGKKFAIINYKHMPTFSLHDSFNAITVEEDEKTLFQYLIKWDTVSKGSDGSFDYDLSIVEVEWNSAFNEFSQKSGGVVKQLRVNGTNYYVVPNEILFDGAFYQITLALSDTTADFYYIGNNNANGAQSISQKYYQHFDAFTQPTEVSVKSYLEYDGTTIEKQLADNNFDTTLKSFADSDIVIIDEDSDENSTPIVFKFKQPAISATAFNIKAYAINMGNKNLINECYVGVKQNTTSKLLYIYYNYDASTQTFGLPYSTADANEVLPFGTKENEIVGEIDSQGNVIINGLALKHLFKNATTNNINKAADYEIKIAGWVPIYSKLLNNHGAGINNSINTVNKVATKPLRYYIKFKTPTFASVVATNGAGEEISVVNTINYVKNGYTLTFTLANEGTIDASQKTLAIFLKDYYKLSDAFICSYPSNLSHSVSITISDKNESNFANIVNQKLPANLTFFAIVLPNGIGTNTVATTTTGESVNSVSASPVPSDYNKTNIFVRGRTINSTIQGNGANIALNIQLPSIGLKLLTNNIITSNDPKNIQEMKAFNKSAYTNRFEVLNFGASGTTSTGVAIALDPYLGFDNAAYKYREYLYAKNAEFDTKGTAIDNFGVRIYINDQLVNIDSVLDGIIPLKDLLKCYENNGAYPKNPAESLNLYNAIKKQINLDKTAGTPYTGGDVKLGVQLVCKTDSISYQPSEIQNFNIKFYIRDASELAQLGVGDNAFSENANNSTNVITYNGTKTDFVYPSAKLLDFTAGDSINNYLVGLTYNYSGITAEKTYYFLPNSNADVMDWLVNKYYTDTQVLLKNVATLDYNNNTSGEANPNVGFILNTLGASGDSQWTINYTKKSDETLGTFVLSNYLDNKFIYNPQLKLINNTIFGGQPGAKETSTNETELDSRFTLKNINTTAKTLNYRIKKPTDSEFESVSLSATNDEAFLNTLQSLNYDSTQVGAMVTKIEKLLAEAEYPYGSYTIEYYYSFESNGRILDSHVQEFYYVYYEVSEETYEIYTVKDGVCVPNNDEKVPELSPSIIDAKSDGIWIASSAASLSEPPNFTVTVNGKGLKGTNYDLDGGVFIEFDPDKATCLGSTAEGCEDWLQPGKIDSIEITPNQIGSNLKYYYNGTQGANTPASKRTVLKKWIKEDYAFKIDPNKYLVFTGYELTPNEGDSIKSHDTSHASDADKTDLDGFEGYRVNRGSEKHIHTEQCSTCHGTGYYYKTKPHHYVRWYAVTNSSPLGALAMTIVYKCSHCGQQTSKTGIWHVFDDDDFYSGTCHEIDKKTCDVCGGLGYVDGTVNSVNTFNGLENEDILAWKYATTNPVDFENDKNPNYHAIYILTQQDNQLVVKKTQLNYSPGVGSLILYSKYKFALTTEGNIPYSCTEEDNYFKYAFNFTGFDDKIPRRIEPKIDDACFFNLSDQNDNTGTIKNESGKVKKGEIQLKTKPSVIIVDETIRKDGVVNISSVKYSETEDVLTQDKFFIYKASSARFGSSDNWDIFNAENNYTYLTVSFEIVNQTPFDLSYTINGSGLVVNVGSIISSKDFRDFFSTTQTQTIDANKEVTVNLAKYVPKKDFFESARSVEGSIEINVSGADLSSGDKNLFKPITCTPIIT